MRALVFEEGGRPAVADLPEPELGPGEALLGVRLSGICGTDLELSRGYMAFAGVPGHEFVGTVLKVRSPADQPLLGARVAGEINLGCLDCPLCAEGLSRHCSQRQVLGILHRQGVHAERVALPVSNLRAVPESLCDEEAVFIEPVAAAFEILDQITLGPQQRVLVLGDGRLGLLVSQVLATTGARVTLAGHHQSHLEMARSWGMTTLRAPEELQEQRFDVTVDATGRPDGLDAAIAMTRPRGIVVLKTTCAGRVTFDAARAVIDEISIIGSRCGRFEPAIKALSERRVIVAGLIEAIHPLEDAVAAFDRAGQPGALKVLLRPGG